MRRHSDCISESCSIVERGVVYQKTAVDGSFLKKKRVVDLIGIEPTISSMPWRRDNRYATGPNHLIVNYGDEEKSRVSASSSAVSSGSSSESFSISITSSCSSVSSTTSVSSAASSIFFLILSLSLNSILLRRGSNTPLLCNGIRRNIQKSVLKPAEYPRLAVVG